MSFRTPIAATAATPIAIYPHSRFNPTERRTYGYDVGLLELSPQLADAIDPGVLPLATSADGKTLLGSDVTLFGFGALEDRYPEIPYKTPDHAWRWRKKDTPPGLTGVPMLQFDRRNRASVVRGGDSGGPWVGWSRNNWRLLSVVNGYHPSAKGRQIGVDLRNKAIRTWIDGVRRRGDTRERHRYMDTIARSAGLQNCDRWSHNSALDRDVEALSCSVAAARGAWVHIDFFDSPTIARREFEATLAWEARSSGGEVVVTSGAPCDRPTWNSASGGGEVACRTYPEGIVPQIYWTVQGQSFFGSLFIRSGDVDGDGEGDDDEDNLDVLRRVWPTVGAPAGAG